MRLKKKRKKKYEKIQGECWQCKRPATCQHDCLTCEKLGKTYVIKTCRACGEDAIYHIRQHALVAHPVNILRCAAAALAGE